MLAKKLSNLLSKVKQKKKQARVYVNVASDENRKTQMLYFLVVSMLSLSIFPLSLYEIVLTRVKHRE